MTRILVLSKRSSGMSFLAVIFFINYNKNPVLSPGFSRPERSAKAT
jgi:hypothetical protein